MRNGASQGHTTSYPFAQGSFALPYYIKLTETVVVRLRGATVSIALSKVLRKLSSLKDTVNTPISEARMADKR